MSATAAMPSYPYNLINQETIKYYTKEDSQCEPDNGHKTELTNKIDFTIESERLKSFKGWKNNAITPETLAKAGFYYLNHTDAVKCAFCKVEGCRWEHGDNPMNDHAKWSPNCPFIKAAKSAETDCHTATLENRDVCGSREVYPNALPENEASKLLKKIGYMKPCSFPNFTTFESRLQSFEDWPKSLKQKPNSLAKAGFFYKGVGDQTMCFHCAGGLKDWEDNDDPWEQHALWFPKCNFLVLSKGQDFVNEVQNKFNADQEQSTPSTSTANLSTKEESAENKSEQVEDLNNGDNSSTLCKICYKNELGIIFIPCGHVVACVDCSLSLNNICPVCRKKCEAAVRAFLS